MIDAPWLQAELQRFDARLDRDHTPQALLVHGPAGVGRRHFSLALAARLLGSPWSPSLETPADQLDGVPHPDYWSVGLEEESRQIKVDQVRELIHTLGLTSHGSGRKVGLIWPADLMNHNAANTLLKTLEEPAAGTTLILVAEAPARLPATVISRCERIRLSPPAPAVALAWLAGTCPDRRACERALAFACGAPLMARAILAEGNGSGVGKLLVELGEDLQQVIERKSTPTTVARSWAKKDAGLCLRWLYLQTAGLLRGELRDAGAEPLLKIPRSALNMTACCGHLDQIMEAQRLKDRSLNMEAVFAELLMWWYGAAGAAR